MAIKYRSTQQRNRDEADHTGFNFVFAVDLDGTGKNIRHSLSNISSFKPDGAQWQLAVSNGHKAVDQMRNYPLCQSDIEQLNPGRSVRKTRSRKKKEPSTSPSPS